MGICIAQYVVRKPICPTFIHDESTRIIVSVIGIVICSYILYRIMKYFSDQ